MFEINEDIKRASEILRGVNLEAGTMLGACIELGLYTEILRLSTQLTKGEMTEDEAFGKLKEFCVIAASSSFAELARFISDRNGIGDMNG